MQPSPELEALVRRFMKARVDSDYETVRKVLADSEHVLIIGSDDGEWVEGTADAQAVYQVDWNEHEIATDEIHRIKAIEHGDTGWVMIEAERTSSSGVVHTWRLTQIYVLDGGSWRQVHTHFSIPVSDDVLFGEGLTKTISDLLTSMPSEDDAEGRTRTVTVVFTDIVDSTALSQTMSTAEWSNLLDEHFAMLDDIVTGEGGTIVKTVGDGGLFVFSSAGAALRASQAIQRLSTADGRLPVRIGLHSGDVIATDDDVVGITVSKAARVASAAEGGQILASAITAGMVNGHEFDFAPPVTAELKGIAGSHQLQALRWE